MANKKTGSNGVVDRPADFDHYAVIRLNPLQVEEIRGMSDAFEISQAIDDLSEHGYKIGFEFLSKGVCQVSALQRRSGAKDAGVGVSAQGINFHLAALALFYKVAIVAQWNLANIPQEDNTSEFR